MKKLTRASIAGAAAVALLLGGAGTLASWNDSETINAGVIKAGTLDLSSSANGIWTVDGVAVTSIDDQRVIPGTKLTYTKTLGVSATGTNLKAMLSIDPASVTGVTSSPADQALAALLVQGFKTGGVTSTAPAAEWTNNGNGTFTITPSAAGFNHTVTFTASVTIPNGAPGAENGAMNGSVNLNGIKVLLTQI